MLDSTYKPIRVTGQATASPQTGIGKARYQRPSHDIDFLTISEDPALGVHVARLFDRPNWRTAHAASWADAAAVVRDNCVAVLISNDELPDGTWRDIARTVREIPNPPALIVISEENPLWREIAAEGAYDLLTRPLSDAHVVWSAGSAWHHWMNSVESQSTAYSGC